MQFKSLIATASLGLIAACGGSGTNGDDGPTTETIATSGAGTAATGAAATGAEGDGGTATAPASFAQCRACHSVEPGKNGIGPTLFGIVGSKVGEVKGYSFSPALAKSGITWDRTSLDTWLKGPMKMVPGTRMTSFQPDAAKRKEIIDYLETLK